MTKFFVTTPIYYVNARPHIGHIYTTIAADVLARYHRAEGAQVLFSTGVDENSQKNVEAAARAGQDVTTYVNDMAAQWEDTFEQLGFSHDVFVRTTSKEHIRAVHALLKAIEQAGDIYLGNYEGFYCVDCEEFIVTKDLVDGKCSIHGTVPKKIKEKNYFFRLSKYKKVLLGHYASHPDFVQPDSAKNKMLYYIEHELADVSISRQAQAWGIRLPQNPKHAIYVWIDALINYITVTGYPGDMESFRQWWPADLHLIGKDLIKFHCAIWPAMLLSAKLPLPQRIFAHGYFTIDGQKISKSLGNAIDPLELIKDYPIDAIRYYVLRDVPFGNDGDFSHQRLQDRYNADLANGLGNLVSRVLTMIEQYLPNFDHDLTARELPTPVAKNLAQVGDHLRTLAFDKALAAIWAAIAWADGQIEQHKPWEMGKRGDIEGLTPVMASLYVALVNINHALLPFLPDTHERVAKLLATRPLKKPSEPLFARK